MYICYIDIGILYIAELLCQKQDSCFLKRREKNNKIFFIRFARGKKIFSHVLNYYTYTYYKYAHRRITYAD